MSSNLPIFFFSKKIKRAQKGLKRQDKPYIFLLTLAKPYKLVYKMVFKDYLRS